MSAGLTMQLHQAASAIGARVIGDDVTIHGVSTDTRSLQAGELFIALRGPNFDGHDYVELAREKGAVACLVDHACGPGASLIVDDTRLALGRLANTWRRQLDLMLVAITGSNGKTTVKEMLASIFAQAGNVIATKGNLNNDIGMPLTLLSMSQEHQSAVIEMGANHAGEIDYLTRIAEPKVGVITNAGAAHLEGFGSLDGVAKAKGEMFAALAKDATAIINADDHYADLWRNLSSSRNVLTFGLKNPADVQATWQADQNGSQITARTPQGDVAFALPLLGEHNVMNALAAITTALAAGASLDSIKAGLSNMKAVPGRLQLKVGLNGSRIIDDTYNANPSSLSAAIHVLKAFPGLHYLALGDMGELGSDALTLHAEVGKQAQAEGMDRLYTIGKMAAAAANAFGEHAYSYDEQPEAISNIEKDLNANVTLLVKGSRLSHMERVVNALTTGGGVD